jgi:hypothetical protein
MPLPVAANTMSSLRVAAAIHPTWVGRTAVRSALILVLILWAATVSRAAGPTNVSGSLQSDTTWTLGGSPYVVTGDVTVSGTESTTVTLTIEAGVEVRFNQYRNLNVGSGSNKGALRVLGTEQSPVLFTSNQDTKTRGWWGNVGFRSSTDETVTLMEHVTVEYGGYGNQGDIYVNGSSPTMRNCTVQDSSNYGLYLFGAAASPVLESSTIRRNAGPGVYVITGSLDLRDMTFSDTEADFAITMPAATDVSSQGTHSFDKPIEVRTLSTNPLSCDPEPSPPIRPGTT